MAEKTPTVTYKKPRRNKRAFKFIDTMYLYESMQEAIEIRNTLEEVAQKEEVESFSDLKPTLIKSELLYNIVDSYIESYEKLLKESLITSANISKIQPTIH